ncbi:ABC transporter permease [Xanthocytophaga agilis]|uniref:ABC transporter permease n=1 Tax=Xanthocytophaga agilis TaxID=3048010 RepID=A0AAE3R3Y9_9BACT|nr:ABC transporter permease [Xanthocytophaga agilis]MDJ1500242.1 ABC transporter permease [Xanthocytophaga agilis]
MEPIPNPPRWADRLLEYFVSDRLLEDVQGDLYEIYQRRAKMVGIAKARREYGWNAVRYINPFFRSYKSNHDTQPLFSTSMIQNYIKIALRSLWKSKGYATINILGLSVAFCICTFLFLTAYNQLTFDSFHADKDRIYQAYLFFNNPDKPERRGQLPLPFVPAIKAEYPEVEAATRFVNERSLIEYKDKSLDKVIRLVDADFLKIFSFPLIKGNRQTAFQELGNIVLNETTANALFGTEDPIGKQIQLKDNGETKSYIVTGVLADAPTNSTVRYDVLVRIENIPGYHSRQNQWDDFSHTVYVKLAENTDPEVLQKKLKSFSQKYFAPTVETLKKKGARPDQRGDIAAVRFQNLSKLHFDSELSGGPPVTVVYVLLGIALFILLIACFNFINLSIARSFTRAREVGVRKYLGALKSQLFMQIWGETTVVCFLGLMAGVVLVVLLVPEFNAAFDGKISLNYVLQPGVIVGILVMFLFVTLLAGGYPAWQMSLFNAIEVLKGKITLKRPGFLRNSLIVTQFAMSCLLTCCTILAVQQTDYLRSVPLGFEKEQIISIPVGNKYEGRQVLQRMRNKFANDPSVIAISGSNVNLGRGKDNSTSRAMVGFDYKGKNITTDWLLVDYDYLKTLNIKLLNGREFERGYAADSVDKVVITESMAQALGEKQAVNSYFQVDSGGTKYQVIGLIADYHLYSLAQKKSPITMHISSTEGISYIFVRVAPQSVKTAMTKMRDTWKEVAPGAEFIGSFVDENVDSWYKSEEKMSQIFSIASLVAILLSCLGLFAVALLVVEQRTKEIGIRKVLGASIANLILILSKDFLKLILIALAIATPLAWFGMQQWLNSYPYKIQINAWVFVGVGVAAVSITLLTVSFQAIKAALMNPVKSLRSE